PPPADISFKGEMPRPSRRARMPISYAEPNLRDKMRRPTKELVDAVSGEGKYQQRSLRLSDVGSDRVAKTGDRHDMNDPLRSHQDLSRSPDEFSDGVPSPCRVPLPLDMPAGAERRKRPSSVSGKATKAVDHGGGNTIATEK